MGAYIGYSGSAYGDPWPTRASSPSPRQPARRSPVNEFGVYEELPKQMLDN